MLEASPSPVDQLIDPRLLDAVAEADVRILVVVLAQLTRDRRWFHPRYRPAYDAAVVAEPGAGLSADAQADVRAATVELIGQLRRGERDVPVATEAEVVELMRLCTAESVPDEYAALMMEELGGRPADVAWTEPAGSRAPFHVVVIGAGVSGLCAAIKLDRLGIDYTVLERNADLGGTWLVNDYPECGVDTPNHLYSYSFAPNPDWPGYFVKRDRIQEYLQQCATDFGIRSRLRFGFDVTSATYDEPSQRWLIDGQGADGRPTRLIANAVISAVGQLNTPKPPDIPGLGDFAGPVFHTAEWRPDVALDGRRVGVIGTGASAMQLVRSTAARAGQLTVFQRTPHWVMPQAAYGQSVGEGTKVLLRAMPFYQTWFRFWLFWKWGDSLHRYLQVDPDWPHPERSLNARHDAIRRAFTEYIETQLIDRPDLLKQSLPTYPPFGKRMLIDNEWYTSLMRDNVQLVTEPIAAVTSDAVVTESGDRHELDVLILASGFAATNLLSTLDVRGRGGRRLRDVWGEDDARAYLGITIPGFPNLFCLYGPNTNLAHGGSTIFHAECQVRYVLECLTAMIEGDLGSIECRADVHDEYNRRVDEAHSKMVWTHPSVHNWYTNRAGRVVSNSPWRLIDYWQMTRQPNLDDYLVQARPALSTQE